MENSNRRLFLKTAFTGVFAGAMMSGDVLNPAHCSAESFRGKLKKSLYYGMLPEILTIEEKFKLAKKS